MSDAFLLPARYTARMISFALLALQPGKVKSAPPIEPPDHTLFGLPSWMVLVAGLVCVLVILGVVGNLIGKAGRKVVHGRLDAQMNATGRSEAELCAEALADPAWFAELQQLVGERVLGIAEVDFPVSSSDETIKALFNTLGSLVGVRMVDKDYGSYLTLTPSKLHYTLFDAGNLVEHKIWMRSELEACSLRQEDTLSERKAVLSTSVLEFTHMLRLRQAGRVVEFPVASMITRSPQKRAFLAPIPSDVAPRCSR